MKQWHAAVQPCLRVQPDKEKPWMASRQLSLRVLGLSQHQNGGTGECHLQGTSGFLQVSTVEVLLQQSHHLHSRSHTSQACLGHRHWVLPDARQTWISGVPSCRADCRRIQLPCQQWPGPLHLSARPLPTQFIAKWLWREDSSETDELNVKGEGAHSVLSHGIQAELNLQGPRTLPMPVHINVHNSYCTRAGPTAFLYSLICRVF